MDELDKFLSDFYSKYAPDSLSPEKVNAIKAGYGNNYDRLIVDLYTKYSPSKLPDSAKMAQIKQGYGLEVAPNDQEAVRKLAIQNPVDAPNWFEKVGNVITNDVPQMAAGAAAALGGWNREHARDRAGVSTDRPERATLLTGELEPMQSYLGRIDKWQKYNKDNAEEIQRSKELQAKLLHYAQEQKLESAEAMRGAVQRLDQISSFTDALDWLGTATSQAVAHIPASIATFGASSALMETGEIYLSAVEKIAEDKSIELGRPVTIEEVIQNGWDDPATAWTYGLAAGALDFIGAKGVTGAFTREVAMQQIKRRGLDILKSSGTEGITEGAQSLIEQIGSSKAAKQSWSDAFGSIDPMDVLESAAQGIAGGASISTAGNIKGAVTERNIKAPEGDLGRADALAKEKDVKNNIAVGATLAKEEQKIDEVTNAVTVIDPATNAAVDQAIKPIVDDTQDDLDLLAQELMSEQQSQEKQTEIEEVKGREDTIDELETKIADLKSKMANAIQDDKPKVWKELKETRRQYKEAVAENERLNYESDKAEFEANFTGEQLDQMSNEDEYLSTKEGSEFAQNQFETAMTKVAEDEVIKNTLSEAKLEDRRNTAYNIAMLKGLTNSSRFQSDEDLSFFVKTKLGLDPTKATLKEIKDKNLELEKSFFNDSENKAGIPAPEQGGETAVKTQSKPSRSKRKGAPTRSVQKAVPEQVTVKDDPATREKSNEEIKKKEEVLEDESDLGPAEPLYNPKKKEVKKEVKVVKSSDPLSDLEKEVSTPREKGKITTLKDYRKQLDEFEANPSFESLNNLKKTQKKVKEEVNKGRTDTYDLEITREQKKLDARLSSLEYNPKVKEAVREGKKAASSAEREVIKAKGGVEKAFKEVVKLRDTAQKKAVKSAEKRLGGTIDPSNALNLPIAKEDQQSIERWKQSAETAAKKYEQLSGKKLTKKEKENLERWGTFESEEERAMRELERDMQDFDEMEDRGDIFEGPEFRKVDSLKSKLLKLDQRMGDSLIAEAKRIDSVRHSTIGIGMIDEEGNFVKGTRFIQGLQYVTDAAIEKLKSATAAIGGRASYVADFYDAFTTANKLREQVGLPPVKLFIAPGRLAYEKGNTVGSELYGFYAPGQSGSIVVSEHAFNERTTALHESIHPITSLFASIARLKLPENSKFNKFKDQLFETHAVAKEQIESLINDLLSNKVVDSPAHTAVLQYFETSTQEEFKQFIANNSAKLRNRNPSVFIYGLVNPSEMASEAFANPAFTNLLVHTKDAKAKGGERNSVFHRIAKNIVDFLKAAYEQITGIQGSSYQRLLDVMSEFEEALQSGELAYDGLAESIIRKEETLEFAKSVKPNKPLPKSFVDKVVDQAIDKDILTLKAFKKFIADLNLKITSRKGETLDKGQVSQLMKAFKEASKLDTLIDDTKKLVETALYQSERYENSPHFQEQVNQVMSIDYTKIDPKDKRTYYNALSGLAEGKITEDLAKIHTKYKAKERVEEVSKTKGFGYRQLSEDAVRFKNPAQIVTDMSKHFTKNANALMDTFYFNIMRSHSRASVATKKQLQQIVDLVKQDKLVREDYLRAGIYGLLVRTSVAPDANNPAWTKEILDNIEYLKATQKEKAAAIALGNEKRWDKKDVAQEDAILKDFAEQIAKGTPLNKLLTEGQAKLYGKFREQLEAMKTDVEENTLAYWGSKDTTKWKEQYNYFPAKVAGRNEQAVLNDEAEAFKDILLNEDTNYGNIQPAQARYSKVYNKSKSAYLDMNLLSVAESYLQSTNYDLYATKELRVLNSVLRNKETAQSLGSKNVRVIRDSLTCHIKSATGRHYNFGDVVRNLEAIKDRLVIAKLGTTGQWFTQLVGQIGAIATYTSVGNATKAASTLAEFSKLYGKSFDVWIEENGAGLQIRDLFFETEQAVQKYAKAEKGRTYAGKALEVSDLTTRYSLKQSDRLAARLVYIASFLEAGGDFKNPSREALVAAERKTILSQNVSDLSFAPSIFRPETSSSRVFLSTVMPFKSFSLQQMLNTYNSLRDFNQSTEAKKLFAANVASTVGYTLMQATAVKWLYGTLFAPFFGAAQAAVAEAVGGDAWAEALRNRDDDDDEKSYGFWEGVFTNSMLDLFFSGAPLQAEKLLDYTINNYLAPNISSLRKGDRAFNEYLDSPIVTPGSAEQLMFSMFGGYQEIASIGTGIVGNGLGWTSDQLFQVFSDDYVKKPNDEFPISAQYRLLMVDAISMFGVFLPFRGDIAKINRELARELKADEVRPKGSGRFKRTLRRGG